MLHHLSGNIFCPLDSSSELVITDLQVAVVSIVQRLKVVVQQDKSLVSGFYESRV